MKFDNIKGFPGYYVSKTGKLYRYNTYTHKWKRYKCILNPRGYLYVTLRSRSTGINHAFRLNRLVAISWIPNPNNLPCVCHKDNNKLNNKVSNLYWGTYKDNSQQMMREGRNKGQFKPSLTDDQKLKLYYLYKTGKYTQYELAEYFNLKSQGNISRLLVKLKERIETCQVGTKC